MKFKAILFVYNLMTGCSKKNRKNAFEAQEPVFLPAIALSPDCSRTLTSATLKLLSEKMKKN